MVYYTESQGKIINLTVSIIAIGLITLHIFLMEKEFKLGSMKFLKKCGIIFVMQFTSLFLAIIWNLISAITIDAAGLSLFWYTNTWLIFGIYCCPMFFWLGIGSFFLKKINNKFSLQLYLDSFCLILAIITIILTGLSFRSSFLFMISIFFYSISLLINIGTKFYKHREYGV